MLERKDESFVSVNYFDQDKRKPRYDIGNSNESIARVQSKITCSDDPSNRKS